jgi:murein L,D-transpeptidase YafK
LLGHNLNKPLLGAIFGGVLLLGGCQKPPMMSLQSAQVALDSAASMGALRYAPADYHKAEATLKSGWMELARQKGRIWPFQSFKAADSLLQLARKQAFEATNQTKDRIGDLSSRADSAKAKLFDELLNWRDALNGTLTYNRAETYWSSAELGLKVCEKLIAQKEYEAALDAVNNAHEALKKLGQVLAEEANNQAQMMVQWRTWVQETIAASRTNGTYAVIVDKNDHKTYLLQAGKVIRKYDCDLGYNSARQKYFAGDGATPEGKYRVVKARPNGSRYHSALLLDYPNATDRRRFQENKAKGVISRHAGIGKNIEIHGDGGRNKDWTDGCVALATSDMANLMKYVGEGAPVTIVRRCDTLP